MSCVTVIDTVVVQLVTNHTTSVVNKTSKIISKMLILKRISSVMRPIKLRCLHYIQGQSPEPKIREYFYFIDHQGQVKFQLTYVKMSQPTRKRYTSALPDLGPNCLQK